MNRYEENSLLIGMVLGDGGLYRAKSKSGSGSYIGNARYQHTHGMNQAVYCKHKEQLLRSMGIKATTTYGSFVDKRYGKRRYYVRTQSERSGRLTSLWKKFYGQDGSKHVTPSLLNRLDSRGLAIWFMDDASLNVPKRNGLPKTHKYDLHTQSFSAGEVDMIVDWFCGKGIVCRRAEVSGYSIVRFTKKESKKIAEMISPHVIPSMAYKLDGLLPSTSFSDVGARAPAPRSGDDIVRTVRKRADAGVKRASGNKMQIPPFSVVLTALNEYGHMARMEVRGLEVLNSGSGISVDDINLDENMTWVATDVIPWKAETFMPPSSSQAVSDIANAGVSSAA